MPNFEIIFNPILDRIRHIQKTLANKSLEVLPTKDFKLFGSAASASGISCSSTKTEDTSCFVQLSSPIRDCNQLHGFPDKQENNSNTSHEIQQPQKSVRRGTCGPDSGICLNVSSQSQYENQVEVDSYVAEKPQCNAPFRSNSNPTKRSIAAEQFVFAHSN